MSNNIFCKRERERVKNLLNKALFQSSCLFNRLLVGFIIFSLLLASLASALPSLAQDGEGENPPLTFDQLKDYIERYGFRDPEKGPPGVGGPPTVAWGDHWEEGPIEISITEYIEKGKVKIKGYIGWKEGSGLSEESSRNYFEGSEFSGPGGAPPSGGASITIGGIGISIKGTNEMGFSEGEKEAIRRVLEKKFKWIKEDMKEKEAASKVSQPGGQTSYKYKGPGVSSQALQQYTPQIIKYSTPLLPKPEVKDFIFVPLNQVATATLSAKLFDQTGDPVIQEPLFVEIKDQKNVVVKRDQTKTDTNGIAPFFLPDLESGAYQISAYGPPGASAILNVLVADISAMMATRDDDANGLTDNTGDVSAASYVTIPGTAIFQANSNFSFDSLQVSSTTGMSLPKDIEVTTFSPTTLTLNTTTAERDWAQENLSQYSLPEETRVDQGSAVFVSMGVDAISTTENTAASLVLINNFAPVAFVQSVMPPTPTEETGAWGGTIIDEGKAWKKIEDLEITGQDVDPIGTASGAYAVQAIVFQGKTTSTGSGQTAYALVKMDKNGTPDPATFYTALESMKNASIAAATTIDNQPVKNVTFTATDATGTKTSFLAPVGKLLSAIPEAPKFFLNLGLEPSKKQPFIEWKGQYRLRFDPVAFALLSYSWLSQQGASYPSSLYTSLFRFVLLWFPYNYESKSPVMPLEQWEYEARREGCKVVKGLLSDTCESDGECLVGECMFRVPIPVKEEVDEETGIKKYGAEYEYKTKDWWWADKGRECGCF